MSWGEACCGDCDSRRRLGVLGAAYFLLESHVWLNGTYAQP